MIICPFRSPRSEGRRVRRSVVSTWKATEARSAPKGSTVSQGARTIGLRFRQRHIVLMLAAVCGWTATEAGAQMSGFNSPTPRNRPVVPAGADPVVASFLDPTVTVLGAPAIMIGQNSFVAPFATLKAGGKGVLVIGNGSDVQDNATIDATSGTVKIGDQVPLAHGTTIIGPATIGGFAADAPLPKDPLGATYDAFISFNAWIENATISPGALVNGLAKVTGGVTIPPGMQVLPGQLVQTQADLTDPTKLAPITASLEEFEVGVLDVNHNFALGYTSLFDIWRPSVYGIGFDPSNDVEPTNPGSVVPIIGGVQRPVPGFKARIVGRVIIPGNNLGQLNRALGSSDAIRGDEGHPITIQSFRSMASQSTFHSLDGTSVSVGAGAKIGRHCVVHGGVNTVTGATVTQIGNNFVLGDESVVYRSIIGDNVTIGKKCYIDSTTLPSGTVVPDRTILVKGVNKGTITW
jgi:carbon dioxide concentrating mechanism protein CcmM